MSKRSFEESSRPAQQVDNTYQHHNGLPLPINDLLSPQEDHHTSPGSSKRPRNFIASVVRSTSLVLCSS